MKPGIVAYPGFAQASTDPGFPGYEIFRVIQDTNTAWAGGKVSLSSGHRYSKLQPWGEAMFDIGGRPFLIDQKGGTPNRVILGPHGNVLVSSVGKSPQSKRLASMSEVRWRPGFPGQACGTREVSGGLRFTVWTVLDGKLVWEVVIPHKLPYLGWKGEAALSAAGRFTAFSSIVPNPHKATIVDVLIVLDLERQIVGKPSDVSMCVKAFKPAKGKGEIGKGEIGNCGIAESGRFAEIKISGTDQYGFIFDIDPQSLICTPRKLKVESLRMGSDAAKGVAGAAIGTVAMLSHPKWARDTHGRDVVIGGGRQFENSNHARDIGKKYGNMLAIDAETGKHTHLTPGSTNVGSDVASMQHSGCDASGWATITTELGNGSEWGAGEVWRVPLDGSKKIQRLCAHRSDERDVAKGGGGYPAEAQATTDPDGNQTAYHSNWQLLAEPKGPSRHDVKTYVVRRARWAR